MGNHRFKLSNMMPNAWFYKIKDMNKPSSANRISHSLDQNKHQKQPPPYIPSRASYYFPSNSPFHPKALDTRFPLDPPRKSNRKTRKNPIVLSPRIISCSESLHSDQSSPSCKITSLPNDIILEVASELKLPPIITKPPPRKEGKKKVRVVKLKRQRIKGISESFAVVKNSSDPTKDFRESMMEMIIENKLEASKDLEELLACYLSLNSDEYHDVIVKVFEEIWFDIIRV